MKHRRVQGQWTRSHRRQPLARGRPRQVSDGSVLFHIGQGHAHRSGADGPHHERHRECDPFVGVLSQRGQALRDHNVGGIDHAGFIEDAQHPGRRRAAAPIRGVHGIDRHARAG